MAIKWGNAQGLELNRWLYGNLPCVHANLNSSVHVLKFTSRYSISTKIVQARVFYCYQSFFVIWRSHKKLCSIWTLDILVNAKLSWVFWSFGKHSKEIKYDISALCQDLNKSSVQYRYQIFFFELKVSPRYSGQYIFVTSALGTAGHTNTVEAWADLWSSDLKAL